MIHFAGNRYPFVIFASPVLQPPNVRHSSSNSGPAPRWIAPSTPPPPSRDVLAALTIASTDSFVISVFCTEIRLFTRFCLVQGSIRTSYPVWQRELVSL